MYGKECDYIMLMFYSQLSHEKEEAERRELQKMLMGDDGKDKGDKSSKSKSKDDDSGPAVWNVLELYIIKHYTRYLIL